MSSFSEELRQSVAPPAAAQEEDESLDVVEKQLATLEV